MFQGFNDKPLYIFYAATFQFGPEFPIRCYDNETSQEREIHEEYSERSPNGIAIFIMTKYYGHVASYDEYVQQTGAYRGD